MNETENDEKTFDERVEQFKERIRQCKTVDEVLCAMADAPGDDAAMCCLCTSNFKIIKDQMNKIASAES